MNERPFIMRIWLSVMMLLGSLPLATAQCDSSALHRELRLAEDVLWSDYPRVLALSGELVNRYRGEGGYCEGHSLLLLATTLWSNGEYDESVRLLHQAIRNADHVGDLQTVARSYHVMANNFYYQAYYDSAEVNFLRARDAFVSLRHRTGQIEVLHDMALMFHRWGRYTASLRALFESEKLKELEPDFVHYVGDFSRGNPYFIDTLYYRHVIANERSLLEKFHQNGNKVGVYQSYVNISVAYHELGDFRRAGYFAGIGARAMKQVGHYPFWYQAAKEYTLAGNRDSCFYFHARALEELHRATQIKVATTYEQLGHSYLKFEELDSAKVYFEKALRLNERMNNRITIPGIHLYIAQILLQKGMREEAESELLVGLQMAHGTSVLHESNLYAFGQELYDQLGQPSKALSFARRHDQLEDSMKRNEDAMVMIRYQAQFASERKERELEAAQHVLRNRTITLLSLAVVTFLSIGFMVILYVQRRKIQRQNKLLEESNAEQKALAQEVHHRVKNNLQYIVSLLSLQEKEVNNPELVQQIDEIKTRIMTMGIIHQRLYQAQGIQAVYLPTFFQDLLDNLLSAFSSKVPVKRQLVVDPIRVDVESAIALGLLINELATNAMKHAFAHLATPAFGLELLRTTEGIRIRVTDNGPGYSLPQVSGRGFGIKLVGLLLRKLKGNMVQPNPNTIEVKITGVKPID
ncbi:MAG: sensor histidine kinase [Cyclobacteriaceae bacterium]|nr:sensor histidine kinase [Cyclobacteriaceae bacterium]